MALGASRRSIVSPILGRAMTLIAIGTALGGVGMLAGQAVLKRMIFELAAPHPLAWLFGAAALVALTAVAAAYPPAMRAASIDPHHGPPRRITAPSPRRFLRPITVYILSVYDRY